MRQAISLLLVLVLLAAGAAWWTVRQAGQLPDWYQEDQAAGRLEPDLEAAARNAQQDLIGRFGRELLDEVTADDGTPNESFLDRVKRRGKLVLEGLRQGRDVRLETRDLEGLILATAYEDDTGRDLLAATRAVRAEIRGGDLVLGAVVTPKLLPVDLISESRRELIDSILSLSGSDGDVYVSLQAAPRVAEGRLLLGPPITLRAGGIEIRSALLSALGVKAPELESGVALDVGRVEVRQATIDGETLVLVVSPEI